MFSDMPPLKHVEVIITKVMDLPITLTESCFYVNRGFHGNPNEIHSIEIHMYILQEAADSSNKLQDFFTPRFYKILIFQSLTHKYFKFHLH